MEEDRVIIPLAFLNDLDFIAYSWDGQLKENFQIDEEDVTDVLSVATQRIRVTATGSHSFEEELGRVSIVNQWGVCVYDRLVQPDSGVTIVDTFLSETGISKEAIQEGTPIETVVAQVEALIQGRRLVGHSIHDDMSILRLWGLDEDLEDVQRIYRDKYQKDYPQLPGPSLDTLAMRFLNRLSFPPPSSTILRAQACLRLYLNHVQGMELEGWRPSGNCALPKGKALTKSSRPMAPPSPPPHELPHDDTDTTANPNCVVGNASTSPEVAETPEEEEPHSSSGLPGNDSSPTLLLLPCGHTFENDHKQDNVTEALKCFAWVKKPCPCGHVNSILCSVDPGDWKCKKTINVGCHHSPKKIKCFEASTTKQPLCIQPVSIKCPAGLHDQSAECHEVDKERQPCKECLAVVPQDFGTVPSPSSNQNTSISLPCGHTIHNPSKRQQRLTPETIKCHQIVKTVSCAHKERDIKCYEATSNRVVHPFCFELVEVTCASGLHDQFVGCGDAAEGWIEDCFHCGARSIGPHGLYGHSNFHGYGEYSWSEEEEEEDYQETDSDEGGASPISLPCGHTLHNPSRRQQESPVESLKCSVHVEKDCPCGHVNKVPCHMDPQDYKCQQFRSIVRPCVHKTEGSLRCHEVQHSSVSICTTLVQVKCKAGAHTLNIECRRTSDPPVCSQMVSRLLSSCGHTVMVPCSQKKEPVCPQLTKIKCAAGLHTQEVDCAMKDIWPVPCCNVKVTKTLACGHGVEVICAQKKRIFCQKCLAHSHPVVLPPPLTVQETGEKQTDAAMNVLCPAGLHIQEVLGDTLPTCNVMVAKTLVCGHSAEMLCGQKKIDCDKCLQPPSVVPAQSPTPREGKKFEELNLNGPLTLPMAIITSSFLKDGLLSESPLWWGDNGEYIYRN